MQKQLKESRESLFYLCENMNINKNIINNIIYYKNKYSI